MTTFVPRLGAAFYQPRPPVRSPTLQALGIIYALTRWNCRQEQNVE